MPKMLQVISKGALLSTSLSRFKRKFQIQLSDAYCVFIVCDKACLQWRLQYTDLKNDELLNSQGQLSTVPQALIAFAAAPSSPKRHDIDIQNAPDWQHWGAFFQKNAFSAVSMASISDDQGSIYLLLVFQREEKQLENNLMSLALDSYISWLSAVFKREKADQILLEDSHRDPLTGLLRRKSFESSFGIVLKDSRRNFLRAALLSLNILSSATLKETELKALAEAIREIMRDNDLIAHFDEREFVMGIRIQHLEDAEIVAAKLLRFLKSAKFEDNRLIQAGLSIGIAFYPEHSSLEGLYQAAALAADTLQEVPGYRIEFHGAYYKSSSDFYS
ncbi:GGDEF domain-containing protein [Marinomonas sp. IMCC 4694]|nr:GGDEF domain-containing protein [Marinomonas sp. IMCC 4694]